VSEKTIRRDGKLVEFLDKHPEDRKRVLAGETTIKDVKRAHKDRQRADRQKAAEKKIKSAPTIEAALSGSTFSTIVVDPPWDWEDEGDVSQFGRGRTTYGSLSFDQLCKLPIGKFSQDDAHIYLWITNRSLPKGFALLDAWGFRYVTCVTWCKPSIGMGNYFRGSTEHLLFGVRGSLPLKKKNVGTWFAAARGPGGHSSKPDEAYKMIEACSPGPYLDVFSRRERAKWVCWGGEL
jgi:N6-adenosine-specific RNA methylase IME4